MFLCYAVGMASAIAAIAVPALVQYAPQIIEGVVKLVEKAFGRGKGQEKKQTAITILDTIFRANPDKSVSLPGADELSGIVDSVVRQLNSSGVLAGEQTPVEDATHVSVPRETAALALTVLESQAAALRKKLQA